MSDPEYRRRIRVVGPATLLKDAAHRLIASTHPSPDNDPHLFRYSVQWKYHSFTLYACDQRAAQALAYHLFKFHHPTETVHRHHIAVTLLNPP